jgi:hypothetical protein
MSVLLYGPISKLAFRYSLFVFSIYFMHQVAVNYVHLIDFRHRDRDLASVQWIEVIDDISNVSIDTPPNPF